MRRICEAERLYDLARIADISRGKWDESSSVPFFPHFQFEIVEATLD